MTRKTKQIKESPNQKYDLTLLYDSDLDRHILKIERKKGLASLLPAKEIVLEDPSEVYEDTKLGIRKYIRASTNIKTYSDHIETIINEKSDFGEQRIINISYNYDGTQKEIM